MWSLPHTESKPTSSASSARGRMSSGRAKGTGYIMPSMQVGMWTPNPSGMGSPLLAGGAQGPDARDLRGGVGARGNDGDWRVEAGVGPAGELLPALLGGAGHRQRVDDVVGHEGRCALTALQRLAERARPRGVEAGVLEDGLAVEHAEVA